MPKTKKPAKPKKQIKNAPGSTPEPRTLTLPKRIWYSPLTWRHRPPVPAYKPLPKARVLFATVIRQMWGNKKLFLGIAVIYILLNLLLVRGLSSGGDLTSLKESFDTLLHGFRGRLTSSLITYVTLLGGSSTGNTATSGVYQTIVLVLCSLAFIWAFRQVIAKRRVRIRDSFYDGMYPLIPFLLVFLLLSVQLLPMVVGTGLYSSMIRYGIAIYAWEKGLWLLILILLSLWSLRMVTATVFAIYIVTLPGMTPLKAYRSARQLVYGRRLLIWRKLIFLPFILMLLTTAIELPLIAFVTPVAVWMFFIISMLTLPLVHGYIYNLYREML